MRAVLVEAYETEAQALTMYQELIEELRAADSKVYREQDSKARAATRELVEGLRALGVKSDYQAERILENYDFESPKLAQIRSELAHASAWRSSKARYPKQAAKRLAEIPEKLQSETSMQGIMARLDGAMPPPEARKLGNRSASDRFEVGKTKDERFI